MTAPRLLPSMFVEGRQVPVDEKRGQKSPVPSERTDVHGIQHKSFQ